jgi:hypothetical protein
MEIGKDKIKYDKRTEKWIDSNYVYSNTDDKITIKGVWIFDPDKTEGGQKIYIQVEKELKKNMSVVWKNKIVEDW